jgi:hypothetical protein
LIIPNPTRSGEDLLDELGGHLCYHYVSSVGMVPHGAVMKNTDMLLGNVAERRLAAVGHEVALAT